MKKNVIFIIVFAAVIIGLVKLHECSMDQKPGWKTIALDEVVSISYPQSVEERSDIPFELLLDKEYKKSLPEGINYEQYRPKLIFLAKNFNEQDSVQLLSFPNIVVNMHTIQPIDYKEMTDDTKEAILKQIQSTIENSTQNTSYRIIKWNNLDSYLINDGIAFKVSFVKENTETQAIVSSVITYLFNKDHEVEIISSIPGEAINEWTSIYDKMVNSVMFN